MNEITLLSQDTIDKIAAGEVVERPASIVKELVENAIDAGANAVTVEIRDGGISLVRITDNGSGIPAEQVRTAFLRHATSKIRTVDDLLTSGTLGFRGEALSSIAAVCQVEMITKTAGSITGSRYVIEGGVEKTFEEIGAPEGTTFLVRNLFYHTPARKKFLKTAATEAGYVSDLMERMALSHPEISFKFISNGDTKLHTSGNCNLKDIIYGIYGREIASNIVNIDTGEDKGLRITGFIGKPVISRGNRNYESYFVNGRYVKSAIVARAIEDAYKPFLMNHRYPFTALMLQIDTGQVDVNVHPTKMEVRFADQSGIYESVCQAVKEGLLGRELIPEINLDQDQPAGNGGASRRSPEESGEARPAPSGKTRYPEPFEKMRSQLIAEADSPYEIKYPQRARAGGAIRPVTGNISRAPAQELPPVPRVSRTPEAVPAGKPEQMELFEHRLLSQDGVKKHRLLGQLFDTYWIAEYEEKLYIIDQHAAHEKVLYERFMEQFKNRGQTSQMLTPPVIVTLSMAEETVLKRNLEHFTAAGFVIEPFGGRDYAIRAMPGDLCGIAEQTVFTEMLDGLTDVPEKASAQAILEKIASMSCKAAVKGNHKMSAQEADALIAELLTLENPYHCPHGRPTIVSMTKRELEKKFRRIL